MESDWMGVLAVLIFISLPFLIYSHVTRTRRESAERMERDAARFHSIDLRIATTKQRLAAVQAWQAGKAIVDTCDERKTRLKPFDFLTEQANRFLLRGEIRAAIEVLEARLPLDREEDRNWRDLDEPWDDPHVLQASYERLAQLLRLEVLVGGIDRSLAYLGSDTVTGQNREDESRAMMSELAEAFAICDRLNAGPLAEQLRARCAKAGVDWPADTP